MKTVKYLGLLAILSFCAIHARNGDDMEARVMELEKKVNQLLAKVKQCHQQQMPAGARGTQQYQPTGRMAVYEEDED